MTAQSIRVLLVEDDPLQARLIQALVADPAIRASQEWASRLSAGLERLSVGQFDAVLLDLSLPDSQGLDTFTRLHDTAPHLPIVVLTSLNDEDLAMQAVRAGAQDYLVKGQVSGPVLGRAIRYAIERKHTTRLLYAQRDLALALGTATSLHKALQLSLSTAVHVGEMEAGGIYVRDDASGDLTLAAHQGLSAAFVASAARYAADSDRTRLIMAGQPLYIHYHELGGLDDARRQENLRASALIPITYQDRVIACLNLASRTRDEVPDVTRQALETIAPQIGQTIARLQAQETLRESEERFRLLLQNAGDAVYVHQVTPDEPGRFLEANERACRMLGYTREEFLQMEVPQIDVPEQRERMPIILQQLYETGAALFQTEHLAQDGHRVPVEVSTRLFNLHDQPTVLSIVRDITERKRAEQERERLLQAERAQYQVAETLRQVAGILSTSLDQDQVLPLILEQLVRVVDYDNASVILVANGSPSLAVQRGEYPELVQMSVAQIIARPHVQTVLAQRAALIIPDTVQDDRWLQWPDSIARCWLGVPLVVRGQTIGLLNLDKKQPGFYTPRHAEIARAFADQAAIAIENARLFTKTQTAYEELKSTQAQLVQSAKLAAIGELAAGVAHELNNPLTAVLGFSELLLRKTPPADPDHQNLADIAEGARRARDIVRNLLNLARQNEFFRQPADANQTIWEALNLSRRRLEHARITIQEHYAPDLPTLRLDVSRIKQVMLNLFTNALHAMPQGGTLTVTTEQIGDAVAVRVADTGVGIPAEHLPRIFDPFFTTKPVGQGTGLGLSISLGIVQEHGGHMQVESQVGAGSTFTIWLPVQ